MLYNMNQMMSLMREIVKRLNDSFYTLEKYKFDLDDLKETYDNLVDKLENEKDKDKIIQLVYCITRYDMLNIIYLNRKDKISIENKLDLTISKSKHIEPLVKIVYNYPFITHKELQEKLGLKSASTLTKYIDSISNANILSKGRLPNSKHVYYTLNENGVNYYLSKYKNTAYEFNSDGFEKDKIMFIDNNEKISTNHELFQEEYVLLNKKTDKYNEI